VEQQIKSAWDEWELIEPPIGDGSYGIVYKAANKTRDVEMLSAVKIVTIRKSPSESEAYVEEIAKNYENEIKTMVKLGSSANIVGIHDYKVKKKGSDWEIHIRMELLESFEEYAAERTMGEDDIIKLGGDICRALELCAKQSPPIIHRDIKPANIFFSQAGDFKLGDFGEARELEKARFAQSEKGTPRYMAPEVKRGEAYNETADICSLGLVLYELSNNNRIPFGDLNKQMLNTSDMQEAFSKRIGGEPMPPPKNASEKMAKVILKACSHKPQDRYQSASEFRSDLESVKNPDIEKKIARPAPKESKKIFGRKAFFAVAMAMLACMAIVGGYFVLNTKVDAFSLEVEPQYVILSLQQTSGLTVKRILENGDTLTMNPNNLEWSSADGGIAKIDGNRIVGLNVGRTTIVGEYQDQTINLIVNVIEPMEDFVDIVQQYELGHKVTLFGGTGECMHTDGKLYGEAEFVLPGSIDIAGDGTIYIADSRVLRRVRNNMVESIEIDPFYMTPDIVRCYADDLYILTNEWQENDGSYRYGIIRLGEGNKAEAVYMPDAIHADVLDFCFSPVDDGLLYFIERNADFGDYSLKTINLKNTDDIQELCILPKGTQSLAIGEEGAVYLANIDTGAIQRYSGGELKYIAGSEGERAFVDGIAPLFYMPQKIRYADNALYVWDFNVLRRIALENGLADDCITVAGEASPEFEFEMEKEYDAENVVLPNGRFCDFAVADGYILLTDPKHGVIWEVK